MQQEAFTTDGWLKIGDRALISFKDMFTLARRAKEKTNHSSVEELGRVNRHVQQVGDWECDWRDETLSCCRDVHSSREAWSR